MTLRQMTPTDPLPDEEGTPKLNPETAEDDKQEIEEAAYYIGLNRERNSHVGDEWNDWYNAEKKIRAEKE